MERPPARAYTGNDDHGEDHLNPRVNILVVEDQAENLMAIEATLERLDQSVFTARSGREALAWCRRDDFAAVLLDVQLPDMDGFEVAAGIRALPRSRRTPILFLTGQFLDDSDMLRGYEAGAVDYLVKPVAPEILRSKVSVFVELARGAALLAEVERRLQAREAEALGDERRRLLLAALADVELWSSAVESSCAGRLSADAADALGRLRRSSLLAARLADPGNPTYEPARKEAAA